MGKTPDGVQDQTTSRGRLTSTAPRPRPRPVNPADGIPWRALLTAWHRGDDENGGMPRANRRLLIVCFFILSMIPMVGIFVFVPLGLSTPLDLVQFAFGMVPVFIWCALFFGGMSLVMRGICQRVGESVHCIRCEYQLGPDPEEYETCPECGNNVTKPMSTIVGARQTQPHLIAVGGILIVAGFFSSQGLMFAPSWLIQQLPTPILSLYATNSSGRHNPTVWNELAARQMTEAQRDRLAERQLNQRERGRMSFMAPQWIEPVVLSNSVSADIVERYFADAYDFYLDMPAEVERGDSLVIRLRSHTYEPTWRTIRPYLVLESTSFNDSGCDCRDEKTRGLLSVGRRRGGGRNDFDTYCATAFRYDTSDPFFQPGDYHHEAAFWILYLPSQQGGYEIEWNDDGTPILPAGTLWANRYELEGSTRIVSVDQTE